MNISPEHIYIHKYTPAVIDLNRKHTHTPIANYIKIIMILFVHTFRFHIDTHTYIVVVHN